MAGDKYCIAGLAIVPASRRAAARRRQAVLTFPSREGFVFLYLPRGKITGLLA